MKTSKILTAFVLATAILISQVGTVFAAPALGNEEERQHPVGAALADYFSDITDYETIMQMHEVGGFGFGVITQALWLLRKIDDSQFTLQMVLEAKQNNDFGDFNDLFEEGSIPQNWGQFRKLILDGEKKHSPGTVMSDQEMENGNNSGDNGSGHGNGQGNGNGHHDNENGPGNGHGNGQGNGQGNGNGNQ